MASAALRVSERKMSTGRVFERAFTTIRSNLAVTLGLAFFFGALPSLGMDFVFAATSAAASDDPPLPTMLFQFFVVIALSGFASTLWQASLTRPVIRHSEGARAGFGESVHAAVAAIVPLIMLTALSVAAIILGIALLIVPGVMLWVIWAVAVPALVAERCGVLGSLYRSERLTRGFRWPVFGLLLVVSLVGLGSALAVEAVSGELQNEDSWSVLTNPLYLSLSLITNTLMSAFAGTVVASLYVELRDWKEGPGSESLEEVFA